jgi:molecular chaperone IbpA
LLFQKEITMTSNTIFPASAFIGFEHMFDELTNFTAKTNNNYPPHNVIKISETQSLIEIAVAGFSLDELTIELKDTKLVVIGDHVVKGREFSHKGISTKNFTKSFKLFDDVKITDAELKNGILSINLEAIIPEDKLSRKIVIKGGDCKC